MEEEFVHKLIVGLMLSRTIMLTTTSSAGLPALSCALNLIRYSVGLLVSSDVLFTVRCVL